jgi:ribosome biogenesis GTPase
MHEIRKYFVCNKTVALLGSSGVGKSTLINTLAGSDIMKVNEITSYKDKGVHTTTRRELVVLPEGGMIIDTPGLRELQLWEGSEGLSDIFSDIEALAENCWFKDCTHTKEPDCAVRKAFEDGTLDEDRLKSYYKMQREINYFERRKYESSILAERKKWKKIHKDVKQVMKMKYKQH